MLYTTFGEPGNVFLAGGERGVQETGPSFIYEEAMPFTIASSSTLSSVDVAVEDIGPGTDSYDVYLVSDNSDSPGSSVFESWAFVAPPVASPAITNLASIGSVELLAGTQYWLIVAPGASNTNGGWNLGGDGSVYSTSAYTVDGGTSWTVGSTSEMAFDVQGSSSTSPEPSTFALLLLPLAWLAVRRVRRSAEGKRY